MYEDDLQTALVARAGINLDRITRDPDGEYWLPLPDGDRIAFGVDNHGTGWAATRYDGSGAPDEGRLVYAGKSVDELVDALAKHDGHMNLPELAELRGWRADLTRSVGTAEEAAAWWSDLALTLDEVLSNERPPLEPALDPADWDEYGPNKRPDFAVDEGTAEHRVSSMIALADHIAAVYRRRADLSRSALTSYPDPKGGDR